MFSAATKTAAAAGGYQISRSLRFNSADSAYLNRTPASAGNQKTWTYSTWIKKADISTTTQTLLWASGSASTYYGTYILFVNAYISVQDYRGSFNMQLDTSAVYRDASAWYHIVVAVDTTQATSSNRVKVYVNGVQITSFATATYPSQNFDTYINAANIHNIGRDNADSARNYFNGYQTETYMVDGQALTPSSFGETNAQTGVWQPKAYSGSYGTNGFYLNFSDNSNTTAATLGKDYSGNGNNWTPNNFSVAAGAGNDSLVDTPTPYGVDTGAGGEVRGNYCTLNAVDNQLTLANGNLDASRTAASWRTARSTLGMSTGKWYWEMTCTGADLTDNFFLIGIANNAAPLTDFIGNNTNSFGYYNLNGLVYYGSGTTAYGNTWQTNDVIGVAFDADAGKIWFAKNGTWQNSGSPTGGTNAAFTGIVSNTYFAAISQYSGDATATSGVMNFGQRPFAYTAPSGFKALCTQNLPTPTIGATTATQAGKFFNPVLYTGNAPSSQAITGVGFQPDFVWVKNRSNATGYFHGLFDAVRGANKVISSNSTIAEATYTQQLNSFDSDGFTVGTNSDSGNYTNLNGNSYVSWNWKANGSGSTNTAGSITSTVSANTTSGFSIVTFTGTGGSATVGHGLGVAPSMIIIKARSGTGNWGVFHTSLGNMTDKILRLNTTDATVTIGTAVAAPTSTTFGISSSICTTDTQVAYCFAPIAGFSAFGSYTGNGSTDGPFVFCGFRPAYILVKGITNNGYNWLVFDAVRDPYNLSVYKLYPNLSDAESGNSTTATVDLLSNGFKIRASDNQINDSYNNAQYIFMAFASNPFKYALAR